MRSCFLSCAATAGGTRQRCNELSKSVQVGLADKFACSCLQDRTVKEVGRPVVLGLPRKSLAKTTADPRFLGVFHVGSTNSADTALPKSACEACTAT